MESGAQKISAVTRICAVYGHPIKHSASPAMHNAALAVLGLDWRYVAFDVNPEHLAEALRGAKQMKFVGINLTVPHKLMAVEVMDELDESAQRWGAVNTVCFEARTSAGDWQPMRSVAAERVVETRMRGFNTDADAIARAIEEDLGLKINGATVLLFGAGGAGRTAALKLASSGARKLYLVNRTMSKAEEVAGEIRQRWPGVKTQTGYPTEKIDLVLNATSLGLREEDPLPIDSSKFSFNCAGAAYDMIYRPAETRFLRAAAEAGCKTANGLGMLLYQGAKALEIWTGMTAPIDEMKNALREHIYGQARQEPRPTAA
jgi:shikimate dehydrogenase